jgi:hypothetical protein
LKSGNPGYQTDSLLLVGENKKWTKENEDCSCQAIEAKATSTSTNGGTGSNGAGTGVGTDRRRLVAFTDESPAYPAKCQTASTEGATSLCYVSKKCPKSKPVANGGGQTKECAADGDTSAKLVPTVVQKVNQNGYLIHEKDTEGNCLKYEDGKTYGIDGHPLSFGETSQYGCS